MALKEGMEYCDPCDPNVFRPYYVVKTVSDYHIIEIMDIDTKAVFPIWKHPKLRQYSQEIINCGLSVDNFTYAGDSEFWINTLFFSIPPGDIVIDVHGAFNDGVQGVRYSGIIHLNEDWICDIETGKKLGLFR